MTRFISFRAQDVGGPVKDPTVWDCTPAATLTYAPVSHARAASEAAGKEVILAVHGFNVSRPSGVRSLAGLEAALGLAQHQTFMGVLWPGDFWLPVVNYPFEAEDAAECGRRLARLLNAAFATAESFSFVSHSLGARLVLEAVKNLSRPAREVCLAAGAVDANCLDAQYAAARTKARRTSVLASVKDKVLRLAYPAGDFASDVLYDDDSPWKRALGLRGPKPLTGPPIFHQQIPEASGYDHGDYLPPGKAPRRPPVSPKWATAAGYIGRCLSGAPQRWP